MVFLQINSRSLRLGANRRNEIIEELTHTSPALVNLLVSNHIIIQCNEQMREGEKLIELSQIVLCVQTRVLETAGTSDLRLCVKVFRCLGSWFAASAMPQSHIVGTKLLEVAFNMMVSLLMEFSKINKIVVSCPHQRLYSWL
jgi:transportin-3